MQLVQKMFISDSLAWLVMVEGSNIDGVLRLVGKAVLEDEFLRKLRANVGEAAKEAGVPLNDAEVEFLKKLVAEERTLDNFIAGIKGVKELWRPYKGR
jgi:hypothetical protein